MGLTSVRRFGIVCLFACLAVGAPAARAAVWTGGSPRGHLRVILRYQGSSEHGRFTRFRVRLITRHGQPVRLAVFVKTHSFTLGSPLLDNAVHGSAWFDVARYPQAVYRAQRFLAGPGALRVVGTLDLKGVRAPLAFPMRVRRTKAGGLVLSGRAVISRLRYGIGTGSWARTDLVGDRVDLVFRVPLVKVGR